MRYQYVKKKGYVRLHTNKGDLNVELHCDKVKTQIFTHTQQNKLNKLTLTQMEEVTLMLLVVLGGNAVRVSVSPQLKKI